MAAYDRGRRGGLDVTENCTSIRVAGEPAMSESETRGGISEDILLSFETVLAHHIDDMENYLRIARRYSSVGALADAANAGCEALRAVLRNVTFERAMYVLYWDRQQLSAPFDRHRREVLDAYFLADKFERFLALEGNILRHVARMTEARIETVLQQCREILPTVETSPLANDFEGFLQRVRGIVAYLRDQICDMSDHLAGRSPDNTSYPNDADSVLRSVSRALLGLVLLGANVAADLTVFSISPIMITLSGSVGFDIFVRNAATAAGVEAETVMTWTREGQAPFTQRESANTPTEEEDYEWARAYGAWIGRSLSM